jgi:hypothetical protein
MDTIDIIKSKLDKILLNSKRDQEYESNKWMKEIPFIPFKQNWKVKPIPPFGGAVVRFFVSLDEINYISVYLDCYSMLGACDTPYWEIYPYNDDTYRCGINDVDKLVNAIDHALHQLK